MSVRKTAPVFLDGDFGNQPKRRMVWQEADGSWYLQEVGPTYSNTWTLVHDGTEEDLAALHRSAAAFPLDDPT